METLVLVNISLYCKWSKCETDRGTDYINIQTTVFKILMASLILD